MTTSPFQFTEPVLLESSFALKREKRSDDTVKIHLLRNVIRDEKKPNTAIVELTIQLNKEAEKELEDACFVAEVKMMSRFVWVQDLEEKQVNVLLERNAIALLISYARPTFAQMTSAAGIPTYHLPFINVSELGQ